MNKKVQIIIAILIIIIVLFFPVIILCLNEWLELLLKSPVFKSLLSNNKYSNVLSIDNYLDYILRILNMCLTLLLSYLLFKLNLNNRKEKERLALFKVKKLLTLNLIEINNICEDKGVNISQPATFNDINPILYHLNQEQLNYFKVYVDFINYIFQKYINGEEVKTECNDFSNKYLIKNANGKNQMGDELKKIYKRFDDIKL